MADNNETVRLELVAVSPEAIELNVYGKLGWYEPEEQIGSFRLTLEEYFTLDHIIGVVQSERLKLDLGRFAADILRLVLNHAKSK